MVMLVVCRLKVGARGGGSGADTHPGEARARGGARGGAVVEWDGWGDGRAGGDVWEGGLPRQPGRSVRFVRQSEWVGGCRGYELAGRPRAMRRGDRE